MSFKILATGSYVPERIVTNDELASFLDTSDEWITRRVGVRERRVCTTETTAELAYRAARNAMETAGVTPQELDLIICATVSGDDASPALACMVQQLLGAECPAFDINAACSAFIYLLDVAAGYFARCQVRRVLIVGAERMSRVLDWRDRSTCVIFGDGAGAAVLGAGDAFLASRLYTKGGDSVIKIPHFAGMSPFYRHTPPPPYVRMNGQETFKFAVNALCRDLTEVLAASGLSGEDLRWVIPHQANIRIIESAAAKLAIPAEKFCSNMEKYGNTSSASIPLLMDEMNRAGRLRQGDYLALCAFGGGLASAACILRWDI